MWISFLAARQLLIIVFRYFISWAKLSSSEEQALHPEDRLQGCLSQDVSRSAKQGLAQLTLIVELVGALRSIADLGGHIGRGSFLDLLPIP